MRDKLRPKLDFGFPQQYDFDEQLCCLTDIRKLPQMAVLKVIRSESDASPTGIADIETLSYLPLAGSPQELSDVFSEQTLLYEEVWQLVSVR